MNRFIDKKGSRVIALLLAIAMLLGSTVSQTTAIASGQDAKAKETLEFDNREEKEDVEALKDDFIDSETSEKVDKEAGASTDEPTDIVSAKDDVTKPDEDNQMPLEQPNEDPKVVDEGDTKESESVDETTDTIVEGKDDSDLNAQPTSSETTDKPQVLEEPEDKIIEEKPQVSEEKPQVTEEKPEVTEQPVKEPKLDPDNLGDSAGERPSPVVENWVKKFERQTNSLRRVTRNVENPVIGVNHPTTPGEVMLFKQATPVPGLVNTWDIILRMEAKDDVKKTSVVLVIDRSGSMNSPRWPQPTKLDNAKEAANSFVDALLPDPKDNTKIGVVSFSSHHGAWSYNTVDIDSQLTNTPNSIKTAINGIRAEGGTNTQAGIREAQRLLAADTEADTEADNKYIVLLSDGEPTASILNEQYVGDGRNLEQNGVRAIGEAAKAKGQGTIIYTVATNAGTTGNQILGEISSGAGYAVTTEDSTQLEAIFGDIAAKILASMKEPEVTDPMGKGFEIKGGNISNISSVPTSPAPIYDDVNDTLSWKPGTLDDTVEGQDDVKYAELRYRVEINKEIIDATEEFGLYATNGNARVSYLDLDNNPVEKTFPVPNVDPVLYTLQKTLLDHNGNVIDAGVGDFTIKATGYNAGGLNEQGQFIIGTEITDAIIDRIIHPGTGSENQELLTNLRHRGYVKVEETNRVFGDATENDWVSLPVKEQYKFKFGPTQSAPADTEFKPLSDKYADKQAFWVNVDDTTGFASQDVSVLITNQLKPLLIDINKVWENTTERPDLTFTIWQKIEGGEFTQYGEPHILIAPNTRIEDIEVPRLDANGNRYIYEVRESFDGSAAYTISHEPPTEFNVDEVVFEFKNSLDITNVMGTKVWVNGPLVGTEVELQLYRNGEPHREPVTTVGQRYTWEELALKDANGELYKYTIQETQAPENYEATYSEDGLTVTNTYVVPTTNITAQKLWQGGHAVDHKPVELKLYRTPEGGAEELVEVAPIISPDSGTHDLFDYTWENLPTHTLDGKKYTYRIEEPIVHSSYTPTITVGEDGYSFTVTNRYHNFKTIEAKKYWYGVLDTSEKVEVWFTLYRRTTTGTDERGPGLNPESIPPGNDSAHWNNLLGEDEEGNPYTFYVKETDKEGNDYTTAGFEKEEKGLSVYNYRGTKNITLTVTKDWTNVPEEFKTPIIVQLTRDGVNLGEPVVLDQANAWTYTWTDLAKYKDQNTMFDYKVVEDENGLHEYVSFREVSYSEYDQTSLELKATISNEFTIPTDASAIATKVWVNGPEIKPTVWFKLYRQIEGGEVEEVPTDQAPIKELPNGTLTVEWTNLEKTNIEGKPYTFTVKEVDATGVDFVPTDFTKLEEGLTVTNTYVSPKTDITAQKIWINGPLVGTEVQLQLFRNGEIYGDVVTTTNLKYTWTNLDKTDENAIDYIYTVKEVGTFENYTTTYSQDQLVITNSYETPLINLEVTKIWVDESGNLDRPTSVEFILYQNDVEYRRLTLSQTADVNTWVNTFVNLPKTDLEGKDYLYRIEEVVPTGYEKVIEEFSITNTRILITIPVTKTWDMVEGEEKPQTITYRLFRGDLEIASQEVTGPEYAFTFEVDKDGNKLPKTNPLTGENYVYTVKEDEVLGYSTTIEGFNVTNTQKVTTQDVSKVWVNETGDENPTEVTAILLRNGEEYKTETLNELNGWQHTWDGLPLTDETGVEYVYTVDEKEVPGYDKTIEKTVITNTKKLTTQDVSKVWVNETGDENPTEVTAILLRDGEEYKEVVLNEENGWKHTWDGLPLTDLTGREYVYTVEEKEVPGYTTAIEGNVITNTRDIIEIDVTKIWVDESGNLDKPESIEFILYRNEVEYKRLALAQDDDEDTWMATFENLPKTDLEGNDYIYTIDEVLPAGYEKVIEEFSITNTRILVTIPVTKVWKTVEDKLPQQITYKLFRNGEEIAEYVASNPEWNYTFEVDGQGLKLPKTNPLDGTDYVYTITEEVVDGYEVSIEGFEVTNTQLTTEIEVSKVWINGPDAKATIELRRSADDVEDTDFVRVFKATKEVTKTTFTELPTHNPDGVEYKYYVVETQIPENFEVKYLEDGLTVENEYVIPTNGKAEAIKVWENAPEQKPTVWFKLFRQIEGAEAQAVPETPIKELANGTTVVAWEELEEADINGNPYTFSVKEVNEKGEDFVPDHYEKTETGLTVTNKYFENPNIEFEKSTKEKEYVEVGQVITYQFRVKNTGDVVLTNIRLTDEMLGIKDKLIAEKLEAGQEVLFEVTYKVTEKDIKAKNIKNIATIHADTPVKKDIPITTTNIIPANPKPKDDPAPKTGDGGAGMYLIILGASSIMLYVLVMNKKKSFKEDVK